MSPSCCKGKGSNDQPTKNCTPPISTSTEVSHPSCEQSITDSCCAKDTIKSTADKPLEKHEKTVSPCTECDGPPNPKEPCCDESCLTRIAARDCEDSCGSDSECASISSCCKGSEENCCGTTEKSKPAQSKKVPCQRHLQSAKSRFQPTLLALGCICHALLALNLESCCVKGKTKRKSRQFSVEKSSHVRASTVSQGCGEKDGCCSISPVRTPKKPAGSCCNEGITETICTEINSSPPSISCAEQCCSESAPVKIDLKSNKCCSSHSCSEEKSIFGIKSSEFGLDLEKGSAIGEHVVLTVQGMTCTGCETKLSRTLATIPGISNIKTSLLLSRAEFDINTAQISIDESVVQLQRATGFECQKVSLNAHELEVLAFGAEELWNEKLPRGVLRIESTFDGTFKVAYDPQIIGARDLVESEIGQSLTLAPQRPDATIAAGNKHVWKAGLATIVSACLTIPVLILAWAPLPDRKIAYGSASLALATVVQVFIAGPFYPAALKSLVFARVIEMDLLIVLSTSAAYIFSAVAFAMLVRGIPLSTGEFFETSTLLVTLIMLGRFVTGLAQQKAVESISVRSLQQSTATIVENDGTTTREIDVRLLQYGDIFRVMPEAKVVTDGVVVSGNSEINESMITGELSPVMKTVGSPVVAGSVNGSGLLHIQLTRLCDDNTISTIANMVDEAKLSKPKIQALADRVAGYFVPVVAAITIVIFIIWIAIGITVQKRKGSDATAHAITYGIAVLIISCPCAIGLAVPMVILIAGGVAADRGVIFKTADTLEAAKNISHVVFDKTGTLTRGRLSVKESRFIGCLPADIESILLGLVSGSNHPISRAITEHLISLFVPPTIGLETKSLPGEGVLSNWNGKEIRAGNANWTETTCSADVQQFLNSGYTVLCVTINGALQAIYALEDTIRPEAAQVVSSLQAKGISVSIVSGDAVGAVQTTATALGIPPSNVLSQCSPADKQAYIQNLKTSSTRSTIIFIGDGTNDAVALATADIGIHMSEGTDVARSAADVVLTRADLRGVLILIELSRKAYRRIMLNFIWSAVYNLFAILLAAGAFVDFRIPPAFAAVGEIVSVLPVIAVAVALRWAKFSV